MQDRHAQIKNVSLTVANNLFRARYTDTELKCQIIINRENTLVITLFAVFHLKSIVWEAGYALNVTLPVYLYTQHPNANVHNRAEG